MTDDQRTELARKYRPATFGDVAGQKPTVAVLYRMCANGTLPGGLLFYGQYGGGKTTLARIVAKALNCEAEAGPARAWPCNACASCRSVDADSSLDVEEVDAASNGTVEKVREIRDRALYGASAGRHRVVLLDEAHSMSPQAFEALLKILEEPPDRTVFILLTTRLDAIPKTVRSRCSPFRFDALPPRVVRERLVQVCQAEGFAAEPALLTAVADGADGSLRNAVNQVDQLMSVGITSLAMWQELTGQSDFAPALLAAAADGNFGALYELADEALSACGDPGRVVRSLTACLADLLVLGAGASLEAQGAALEARQALAARLGPERVSAAVGVLWDFLCKVRVDDRDSGLSLALAMTARALGKRPAPIADQQDAVASLAQVQEILGRA